jgi:hypothetical protein
MRLWDKMIGVSRIDYVCNIHGESREILDNNSNLEIKGQKRTVCLDK